MPWVNPAGQCLWGKVLLNARWEGTPRAGARGVIGVLPSSRVYKTFLAAAVTACSAFPNCCCFVHAPGYCCNSNAIAVLLQSHWGAKEGMEGAPLWCPHLRGTHSWCPLALLQITLLNAVSNQWSLLW